MAISQDQFRMIISGRRRDAGASVARALLRLASLGYGLAVRIRNAMYDAGILKAHRVDALVICVGNLTTGGTGKTPLVAWLTRHLQAKGLRVAILTRGYRSNVRATHASPLPDHADEPAELASACPGTPIIVNPDRVAGAAEAIGKHGAQVLVMDDGFQHRRLTRDIDIITIDATEPFGYGRLLPAGLLREPLGGLRRAHAVVLTRCDQVSPQAMERIESTVRKVNPNLVFARSAHTPSAVRLADGSQLAPAGLKGKKVFAFCGIGNPDGFLRTVESCGCRIVGKHIFDDHQAYSDAILADLHSEAKSGGAGLLLTTQKDWTKIQPLIEAGLKPAPTTLAYLAIELAMTSGGEKLTALLDRASAGRISTR
jgi:tetraacyldisaccharide 4'-kinase